MGVPNVYLADVWNAILINGFTVSHRYPYTYNSKSVFGYFSMCCNVSTVFRNLETQRLLVIVESVGRGLCIEV